MSVPCMRKLKPRHKAGPRVVTQLNFCVWGLCRRHTGKDGRSAALVLGDSVQFVR